MNCETDTVRFLAFSSNNLNDFLSALRKAGASRLIVRKHSDSVEIDFRLKDLEAGFALRTFFSGEIKIEEVREDFSNLSLVQKLAFADELISEERYWEAHNVMEDLWKSLTGKSKQILHDVIGLIVSQIKVQMGQNDTGAVVYDRTLINLKVQGIEILISQLPQVFTYPIKFKVSGILELL